MTEPSPIVVYLDTNDYINIHQHRQEESISSVLTYLKDQTALGHIIVAYSPMIVLEFLTRPGAGFTPNRVDRGKLLSELCGLNVFSMEFGSGNKLLRSDGNWMGPGLTKGISIKAKLAEGFAKARKEGLSTPGLNRAMKRKIASDSYIFSQLKSSSVKFGRRREDFGTMPVSQEFLDGRYFERYIKGQIREQTVQIAFTKWLRNV